MHPPISWYCKYQQKQTSSSQKEDIRLPQDSSKCITSRYMSHANKATASISYWSYPIWRQKIPMPLARPIPQKKLVVKGKNDQKKPLVKSREFPCPTPGEIRKDLRSSMERTPRQKPISSPAWLAIVPTPEDIWRSELCTLTVFVSNLWKWMFKNMKTIYVYNTYVQKHIATSSPIILRPGTGNQEIDISLFFILMFICNFIFCCHFKSHVLFIWDISYKP